MDYINWLHDALHNSQVNTNTTDLTVKIWNERDFEHASGTLKPVDKTVNIILRSLANDISYNVVSQPYELSIWSEANDIQETQAMLNDFVNRYNFFQETLTETVDGKTTLNIYKHSYSSPIMLDPYQQQGTVIRAMFLLSANIVEIINVADLKSGIGTAGCITINGVDYLVTQFSFSMVSNPNTRMIKNVEIAQSIIEGSVLSISFAVPCIINAFTTNVFSQMAGNQSSDSTYTTTFIIGNQLFSFDMKISSVGFSTQPDAVPSLLIGMVL